MKKKVEIIYRIFFIIVCGICIGAHFNINDAYVNAHAFSFFTVQSNIFCLIMACILLIKEFYGKNLSSKAIIYFKGMALSAILCASLIYHFGESSTKYPLLKIGIVGLPVVTLLSHYIVPTMFLLDWLIFQAKGYFKWHYIISWLVFPLFYFVSFITRCYCNPATAFENVDKYPYFFLDYESLGLAEFFKYVFIILIIIVLINLLLIIMDNFMCKKLFLKNTANIFKNK